MNHSHQPQPRTMEGNRGSSVYGSLQSQTAQTTSSIPTPGVTGVAAPQTCASPWGIFPVPAPQRCRQETRAGVLSGNICWCTQPWHRGKQGSGPTSVSMSHCPPARLGLSTAGPTHCLAFSRAPQQKLCLTGVRDVAAGSLQHGRPRLYLQLLLGPQEGPTALFV